MWYVRKKIWKSVTLHVERDTMEYFCSPCCNKYFSEQKKQIFLLILNSAKNAIIPEIILLLVSSETFTGKMLWCSII